MNKEISESRKQPTSSPSEVDSSSEDDEKTKSGYSADSDTDSGIGLYEASSSRPKISVFLKSNNRQVDNAESIGHSSLHSQEIEAQRIAPQLTSIVGKSMRDLDSTLKALGLVGDSDDEESIRLQKRRLSNYSGLDLSISSNDVSSLRNQINAVDEGGRLALLNSPLPRIASVPSFSEPQMSHELRYRVAQAAVDEVEAVVGENTSDDEASDSLGSLSSHSRYDTNSSFPTDAHKPASPPPLEPKLKIDEAESSEHDYTFLARIIFVFVICALVYAVVPAISGKSLPPVSSTKQAEADGPSIRNSKIPGTPAARTPQPSDDDLYDAFEDLVGSDIYVKGSSQYLAAWWILEKDTRRHRATLERLEQRFLLAFFYFETTNNGETPWLSCNYELASSVPFTTGSRQGLSSHGRHKYGSRTAPTASERGPDLRSVESSCEFDRPLYDELGNLTGYTTTESFRWLSGHSECSWAGITCKHEDDSLQFDPVVEINLEGQMEYDTVVTEVLQLPHLELLYY